MLIPEMLLFTVKDTKLNIPVVTLSARDNQKLSKRFSKEFERSVYWNEYKTKSMDKKNEMNLDIFLNQILLELIDYLYQFIQIKVTTLKVLKLKIIIYQKKKKKIMNVIINENNVYDQGIELDAKLYEKIRK